MKISPSKNSARTKAHTVHPKILAVRYAAATTRDAINMTYPRTRRHPAIITSRPWRACQLSPSRSHDSLAEGCPCRAYHQARRQYMNCAISEARNVLTVAHRSRLSFFSTALSADLSACCCRLVVRSPRVRSVTPRTISVIRRRLPVMASGKSIVTSKP
jgi:hypothetical protein